MLDYKVLGQGSCFTNFSSEQDKIEQSFEQSKKKYTKWEELFERIKYLWDQDSYAEEIEIEIERNVKSLFYFLRRNSPPDEIYQKFINSGFFVDMFHKMVSMKHLYKDYVLGIICLIIKKRPDGIPIMLKRGLSDSFDTYLFSKATSEKMQILTPFFVSMYLKCMIKSNQLPLSFFLSPRKELNYFQISCQIIEKCLAQENEKSPAIDETQLIYIQKTEIYIFSFFSYLVGLISVNNPSKEKSESPEINQIFSYIEQALKMNLEHLYLKTIKCLDRIWGYSYQFLQDLFFNESIYQPICNIINTQNPANCQQNASVLIYKLLEKEPALISKEIDSEKVLQTASNSIGMMMKTNIFDKTTISAVFLLGKKFLCDKEISIDIEKEMDMLLGLADALLGDLDFLSKNAAAILIFAIVQISGLTFFQDKINLIEKAFEIPISGDLSVVENAINAADVIYHMIDSNNECALLLSNCLEQFVSTMYQYNEIEIFSDQIEILYNKRIKRQ